MNIWKDKNVLITGCTGFVGSWLTDSLIKKGANVVGLVRDILPHSLLYMNGAINRMNVVYGSLKDYHLIERVLVEYDIDTIFHLAAQALVGVANKSPVNTFKSNILGTWNILEACRNTKLVKKIIVASSDKAYGEHKKLPYKEDFNLQGRHPYDASKTCADILSQTYYYTYNLPINIVRCGNIYGGGDLNFNRIIPDTIRSIINGGNPVIRSDGTYIRDYIYIKDAVSAYITLAEYMDKEGMKGEAFNFGAERPITVLKLVENIIKISGKTGIKPKIINNATGEIKNQYLSCEKSRKVLKWSPKYTLDKGLAETYIWYKKYLTSGAL